MDALCGKYARLSRWIIRLGGRSEHEPIHVIPMLHGQLYLFGVDWLHFFRISTKRD